MIVQIMRVKHDYVSRKSEETGEHWSKKLITLPNDLHEKVMKEAANMGMSMYEAYVQAAHLWLKSRGMTGTFKGFPITGDEEAFINRVLDVYQNRKENSGCADAINIIDKLIKMVKPTKNSH